MALLFHFQGRRRRAGKSTWIFSYSPISLNLCSDEKCLWRKEWGRWYGYDFCCWWRYACNSWRRELSSPEGNECYQEKIGDFLKYLLRRIHIGTGKFAARTLAPIEHPYILCFYLHTDWLDEIVAISARKTTQSSTTICTRFFRAICYPITRVIFGSTYFVVGKHTATRYRFFPFFVRFTVPLSSLMFIPLNV